MKTVEDFTKEVEASEVLKNELKAIKDKDALAEFLKKNDVGATVEEFKNFIKTERELTDDDAGNVAGGMKWLLPF